jgi:signal transduction histidine kinase
MRKQYLIVFFIILICTNLFAFENKFTNQEKKWITENEVRVGMYPFYPPFAYIVQDESIIGLFPDLREIIRNYSGLKFKQVFYPNWESYLRAAQRGEIDIIMPIIPTDERKNYLNFSKPIVMDPHAIVVRTEDKDSISFDNIRYKKDIVIGAVKGYFITDFVKEKYSTHTIRYFADDKQCIEALMSRKVDVFVTQTYTAGFFIYNNQELSVISDIPTNTILAIGITKNKPILHQIINKTLDELPENTLSDLINNWTYQLYQPVYKKLYFWMLVGLGALFISLLLFAMNKILQIRVKNRTQDLMEAKLKAEESEALKTSFVLNISHEIRTPLNAINGFSELLALQFDDETIQTYSRDIIANSHRLTNVIESMIIFSQLESGKIEFDIVPVKLCDIIEAVSLKYKEMYPERLEQVEFEVECAASSLELETDTYYLRKMLGFVVDNAFKFTRSGKIRFGFRVYHEQLSLFVEDTGEGIKSEAIPKIFDRFYKFSVSDEQFHAGTGVGLTVVKKLAKELGFELKLDSEFGHGTTIRFYKDLKER